MAVTDDEFQALSLKVEGLSVRVRTLEDDRAIDRAEAEVRHRAVLDSMQALRTTQVEQGREIGRLRTDMDRRFEQVDRRFEQVDRRFEQVDRRFDEVDRQFEDVHRQFDDVNRHLGVVRDTLVHVVRLLEQDSGADGPESA